MGYYIDVIEQKIVIKKENFSSILETIKNLTKNEDNMSGGSWGGGASIQRWFSWVSTDAVIQARTVAEALSAWRWEPHMNKDGDITYLYFRGEKLGDDAVLFKAIAPFVDKDSYVAFRGEDGLMWRYIFDGEKMAEQQARIVWE